LYLQKIKINMSDKQKIEQVLQESYGSSGIAGLVKLMQLNYNMRNLSMFVSYKPLHGGFIIVVDNLDPDIISNYKRWKAIAEDFTLTDEQADPAKINIRDMKFAILESKHKTDKDRMMFINAEVRYIQFTIGGDHLVNYMIE